MLGAKVPGLVECCRCPRLSRYIETLPPKKQYTRSDYWARPVPGFGDPKARICLVGLAPGAHGANRTGRPFTGDGAGDFMYPLLYRAGFTSQPEAEHSQDGLVLDDLYITNAVKCVPPENKPKTDEFERCQTYLEEELASLERLRVLVLLGREAYLSYLKLLKSNGVIGRLSDHPFRHGQAFRPPEGPWVLSSYHTSRYNVQTGRMTPEMFGDLLDQASELARPESG
ncbi:MAG: uracil-DNA glycosylase [Desulfuromonadales bacterium]